MPLSDENKKKLEAIKVNPKQDSSSDVPIQTVPEFDVKPERSKTSQHTETKQTTIVQKLPRREFKMSEKTTAQKKEELLNKNPENQKIFDDYDKGAIKRIERPFMSIAPKVVGWASFATVLVLGTMAGYSYFTGNSKK